MPRGNVDYSKGLIYTIRTGDSVYVGSTTDFRRRKYEHKNAICNENNKNYNQRVYQTIRDNGEWMMKPYKEFPCNSKLELEIEEEKIRRELNADLNMYACRGFNKNEYDRKWRKENPEKKKEYDKKGREKHAEKRQKWRDDNKEYMKNYNEENKEKIKERKQETYRKNIEKIKEYRENNKEKIKAYRKEYYEQNKDELNRKKRENRERRRLEKTKNENE